MIMLSCLISTPLPGNPIRRPGYRRAELQDLDLPRLRNLLERHKVRFAGDEDVEEEEERQSALESLKQSGWIKDEDWAWRGFGCFWDVFLEFCMFFLGLWVWSGFKKCCSILFLENHIAALLWFFRRWAFWCLWLSHN